MLVDTHCHLYLPEFAADLEDVLTRAHQNHVNIVVVAGIDAQTSLQCIKLAEKYEEVYAAVGIHPNSEVLDTKKELNAIRSWLSHPKIIAVGEIGLDYHRASVPIVEQRERFVRQLEFADEANLPIIVHNRNAIHDLHPLVAEWVRDKNRIPQEAKVAYGVFHSFSEDREWARELTQLGFLLGISGVVTFPNAHKTKEVVRSTPLTRLLLETDAPYLCPQPCRGKRNEPAHLNYIAQEMAALLGVSTDRVAEITSQNAKSLFGIG
ncbi:MAG: TatD family hydrolase [Anaerolineales bacterium]|nr:TatD family hydrolase [Anaerolineales bacterium]MDW8447304.1 TatD family hydrolase [Anaerolineales bacterium]